MTADSLPERAMLRARAQKESRPRLWRDRLFRPAAAVLRPTAHELHHALLDVLARLAGLLLDPADELIRILLGLADVCIGQLRELTLQLRLELRELRLKLLFCDLIEAHAHLLSGVQPAHAPFRVGLTSAAGRFSRSQKNFKES